MSFFVIKGFLAGSPARVTSRPGNAPARPCWCYAEPVNDRHDISFILELNRRPGFPPILPYDCATMSPTTVTRLKGINTVERDGLSPFTPASSAQPNPTSATLTMSFFAPAPPPPTKLGRHRQLAPIAGIHVSPLCLGGMSLGDQWQKFGMGSMDKEASFKLLDAFYEAGGNFIDTANNYQNETSEKFIGEWMETRGVRDQMVIATKYTTLFKLGRDDIKQKTSYAGNSVKSMHISVEESLKKLRTSYIDILYVHWILPHIVTVLTPVNRQWDWTTTIEEVMNGLHNLVAQGKVLYLPSEYLSDESAKGVSDTPAWVVSRANTYARMANKTPFVVYQGAWSVLQRDLEREIIPMCRVEGMAIAPWNVLAAGKIRTDAEEEERRRTGEKGRTALNPNWERNETERKMAKVLEEIAAETKAANIQAVAIAYVMQKVPYVFPIIGGRKVEHFKGNLDALEIALTEDHFKRIESVQPFDVGFPANFIGDGTEYNFGSKMVAQFDKWPLPQALRPQKN
ncbi:hypothetical protein ACG7TL_006411 [Trametes sanguinea]